MQSLLSRFNPLHQLGNVTTDEPIALKKKMSEFRALRTTTGLWFACDKWWSRWELGFRRSPSGRTPSTPGRPPFARITLAKHPFRVHSIPTGSSAKSFSSKPFPHEEDDEKRPRRTFVRRGSFSESDEVREKVFKKMVEPVGIHVGLPGLRPMGKPPVCAKMPSWHFCEPT